MVEFGLLELMGYVGLVFMGAGIFGFMLGRATAYAADILKYNEAKRGHRDDRQKDRRGAGVRSPADGPTFITVTAREGDDEGPAC